MHAPEQWARWAALVLAGGSRHTWKLCTGISSLTLSHASGVGDDLEDLPGLSFCFDVKGGGDQGSGSRWSQARP